MRYFFSDNINKNKFNGNCICLYEISKIEVDNQNFRRLDDFMDILKSYTSLARQKVLFCFSGYDDKCELIYIPEAVNFTKRLIKKHPYFWYYAIQHNSEFFYLALFVNEDNMTIADVPAAQSFYMKLDMNKIKKFITIMAMSLNIFGEEINDIEGSIECLKLWCSKIIGYNF